MREDFFSSDKDVHLHIDRDTFIKLRSISYVYGVTINDIMNEFCLQLCSDKPNAVKILEDMATKKAEEQLGRKPLTSQKGLHKAPLNNIETNILYNLIDQKGKKNDKETDDDF